MMIPMDITFHPSWWYKKCGVSFSREFFFNEDYRIDADIKMRKALYDHFGDLGLGEKAPQPRPILGSDLIASGFLHSELLGCKVHYADANPPEVVCKNITDEETEQIKAPDLNASLLWREIQGQLDRMMKKYGYVESCINLMGIQNLALDLRGAALFIDYYEDPDKAHHLLNVCTKLSIDIAKRLRGYTKNISSGVTAIVKKTVPNLYLTSNCTVEMVSLDIYKEFLLPYDKVLAETFGPFGIHHCGKTMEHVVKGYAQVPHLKFAEVGAYSDIKAVRKVLPYVHLNARYSPVRLKQASKEEMKNEVAEIVRDGGPLELLSVSCVGIDGETPDSCIRDFLSACKEAADVE